MLRGDVNINNTAIASKTLIWMELDQNSAADLLVRRVYITLA